MRTAIILHQDDKLLIEELAGTTESESPSGLIRFHTPVADRDHRTDSLRAALRAIQSLSAEQTGYAEVDIDQYGWLDLGGEEESEYGF